MEQNQTPPAKNIFASVANWYKTRGKNTKVVIWAAVFATVFAIIGNSDSGSSSSSSSSSGVGHSHTCLGCGKVYTGNGWMTINGEQYQPSSDNGDQYCSKQCAYDSQPAKWKK